MKVVLVNMRMEVTVEDGDVFWFDDDRDVGEPYKGSPIKFIKHLAKHEWVKLFKPDEEGSTP